MTPRNHRQVNAHHINSYSCKDETDTDPEAPISMCASPIGNGIFMVHRGTGSFVRMVMVLDLAHFPLLVSPVEIAVLHSRIDPTTLPSTQVMPAANGEWGCGALVSV